MAAALQSRSSRRGGATRHRQSAHRPMSEINVTPFVDVMLVLLVIFMVTAPLLTVGVEVNLPKTKANAMSGNDEPLTITVDVDGIIYLQETTVDLETLVPRLQSITGANPDARIFIRGDSGINYGRVMEVMGVINAAGYQKVGLVTASQSKIAKQNEKTADGGQ